MKNGELTSKQKMHRAKCAICNHKDRNEIEEKYLNGVSPYQIEADYPGVSNQSVYAHMKIFGLEEKRDNSTLAILNRIIDRGNAGKIQITPGVFMEALKLRAKISGETGEGTKQNVNVVVNQGEVTAETEQDLIAEAIKELEEQGYSVVKVDHRA